MNRRRSNPTKLALPLAAAAACGLQSAALPQLLAQDTASAEKLEKVVVTGSMIPTAETVGAAPVETVSAVDIEKASSQDVLQLLKKLSTSFSGGNNVGQTINNRDKGGGEANIAIRNLPTLVLLDGRRLANSAFSNGTVVDVNTIPIAMIDHLEVLKDGASTIYGSDAIGGVVNIITKKNWNGVEVSGRFGFPTRDSSNNLVEYRGSLVAGTSTDHSSFLAGGSYYHMDPLLGKDRNVASASVLELANIGINPPTYVSGSFPARVANSVLVGSDFAKGTPQYQAGVITPPIVAGGPFTKLEGYNAAAKAALGYEPYIPIDTTPLGSLLVANGVTSRVLLNTPLFGTHSIQTQDRKNAFANFEHDLMEKRVQAFGSFYYANNKAEGALAPSPVPALGPAGLNQIAIPANNPYNPFGIALGVNGAGTPRVRTRFIEVGNRVFDSVYDYYRLVAGIKGELDKGYSYELAYAYNHSEQSQFTHNAINGAALNDALRPDPADPTGKTSLLIDANGNQVPTYNPFALPGFNDARTIDALRATLINTGVSQEWGVDGVVRGTPVELPAGPLGIAVGGQYYEESLSLDADGLTKTGNAPGLNPLPPFPARKRNTEAVFAEVLIPVFSPEKSIPGFHGFDITVSGRYTTLDPGGDSLVPKVGFRWQPLDEQLTLRGTYSQSFIAPSLFSLYGPPTADNPFVTIVNPLGTGGGQVTAAYPSNPGLVPSSADTFSLGLVYSPKQIKGLTVTADFYRIDNQNIASGPDLIAVSRSLNLKGSASPYAGGFLFDDGTKLTTTAPNQVFFSDPAGGPSAGSFTYAAVSGANQQTDGLDLGMNYKLETDSAGTFTLGANANVLLSYYFQGPPSLDPSVTLGRFQYRGYYTSSVLGAQGVLPEFMVTDYLSWEYRNFTFTASSRFIPEVVDRGTAFPTTGLPTNDRTINGSDWLVPSYYTIDLQLAYQFGKTSESNKWLKGTRVAVGVNNVTDNMAPFISNGSEDNTDKSTYDILGRFVYFEVSKRF